MLMWINYCVKLMFQSKSQLKIDKFLLKQNKTKKLN